jgi:hypothetical protein
LPGAAHYYNRYRDYDPTTGRYIQADPIGLEGDENPYAYALGNPLRYADPTGEFGIPGAIIGAGASLATQAATIWSGGGNVYNLACYNWAEVGVSGALGAIGGGFISPGLKLTKGSMLFNNVSRRIRRAHGLVGKPVDIHHGILPRRWEKAGPWAQGIVNHPMNLRAMPRQAHRNLHRDPTPLGIWGGLPRWAQAGAVSVGVGAGTEAMDGD